MRHLLISLLIPVALFTLMTPSAAQAAPPPKGYPTARIVAEVQNKHIDASIPIRGGFYDGDANIGFGFDKVWHKHNIRSLRGMKFMAASPNAERQGTSWVLTAYAGKVQCPITGCKVTAQQELRFIYV